MIQHEQVETLGRSAVSEPPPPSAEQLDKQAIAELEPMFGELQVGESASFDTAEMFSALKSKGIDAELEEATGQPASWEEAQPMPGAELCRCD